MIEVVCRARCSFSFFHFSKICQEGVKRRKKQEKSGFPREVALEIAQRLGLSSPSALPGWYSVTTSQLLRHGGIKLPFVYLSSIQNLAKALFPDHLWIPSRFQSPKVPTTKALWADPANVRSAMLSMAEELGFDGENMESWYQAPLHSTWTTFWRLWMPFGSKLRLLQAAFPEHQWDATRFKEKPKKYWKYENLREAVNEVGDRLGIRRGDYEAWYKVKHKDLVGLGLGTALHGITRYEFFSKVFPEHHWSPDLFPNTRAIDTITDSPEELTQLCKSIEMKIGISSSEQWFKVTKQDLQLAGFKYQFPTQAYLIAMLQVAYPSDDWNPSRFTFGVQGWGALLSNLVYLFGRGEVRIGKKAIVSDTNSDLDDLTKTITVSRYNLLFDYQGPNYYAKPLIERRKEIVKEERPSLVQRCSEDGLTLVSVPFWIDHDKKYLLAELYRIRSDLFSENGPLIKYKHTAIETAPFAPSIARKDISMPRSRFESWKKDPRFESLFLERALMVKTKKKEKKKI